MTDKQIIIDGVDVSGCPYYIDSEGGCSSHDCECIKCIHNVCFYKDYKAKEQECEALQMSDNEAGEIIAELTAYKDINEDFKTAWKELKAENEELKKIINEAKNSNLDLKSFLVGEAVGKEYEQQLDQLKQTLAEIKEIAEPYEMTIKKICGNCKKYNSNYGTCNKNINRYKPTSSKTVACEEFTYLDELVPNIIAINILQKISECEVNNDR